MENYIMLNGKRIDLTAEQVETLVGKKEKDPFERVKGGAYCYIDNDGRVETQWDEFVGIDNDRYEAGNYCTDKELMKQRALHETLNRLLWRYSMQNGGREIDWSIPNKNKWVVSYDFEKKDFCTYFCWSDVDVGTVYFYDGVIAKKAIEEIVKPFMEKHPEFRW